MQPVQMWRHSLPMCGIVWSSLPYLSGWVCWSVYSS